MNKWEDSFKKMSGENNSNKLCHCSDNQGLFIPNRQLSVIVATILLLAFFVFMTGYFLGKKKVVEQFTQEMHQDAFADKIYTTVLSTQENQQLENNALLVTHVDDAVVESPSAIENIALVDLAPVVSDTTQRYYAQLIGFGTEKAAQLFVDKLLAKGIETEVKKRVSKTVKGRTSYWYQVVTVYYSNKNDVVDLVARLAKEENIKDARICTC